MVATLQTSLAGLATEKTQLETAKSGLMKEKEDLTAQAGTLAKEKTTLNDQLAALGDQLKLKLDALKDVETQRERLAKQADELDKIVATLQNKLTAAGVDLATMQKLSAEEKALAVAQLKALETKSAAETAKAEDYLARLRRAAELFKGMQTEKQELTTRLTDAEKKFQQQLLVETRINRELVGIRGPLKRVAIIFDASGSMKEAGNGGGDRWQEAQTIAQTWLQHLDVDECVLIVYSSDVRTFPPDGTLATFAARMAMRPAQVARTPDRRRTEGLDEYARSDAQGVLVQRHRFDDSLLGRSPHKSESRTVRSKRCQRDLCPLPPTRKDPGEHRRLGKLLRPRSRHLYAERGQHHGRDIYRTLTAGARFLSVSDAAVNDSNTTLHCLRIVSFFIPVKQFALGAKLIGPS